MGISQFQLMQSHNSHSSVDGFGEVSVLLFGLPTMGVFFSHHRKMDISQFQPMGNNAVPHTEKGEKQGPTLDIAPLSHYGILDGK